MHKLRYRFQLILTLTLLSLATTAFAQSASKATMPKGKPVLFEEVNISERNLLLGPGGTQMKPNISKIAFVKEETKGWSKKYRVKDASGKTWVAKIGVESQPETAAVRLIWGLGYKTEINYLVPKLTIEGRGTFDNVRLEARPANIKRTVEWDWKNNPFVGTKELQGLKIMMAFLTNWDIKNSNNKVLSVNNNGTQELHYIVSDLGATIGKTGGAPLFWRLQRSRNEPVDYSKSKFVTEVKNGYVKFSYGGKMRELFDNIKVEDARWLGNKLSQLTDEQIRDAFRAANYNSQEVELLLDSVKSRIAELNKLTEQSQAVKK